MNSRCLDCNHLMILTNQNMYYCDIKDITFSSDCTDFDEKDKWTVTSTQMDTITKEIHFYTNLNDIEHVSDWDLETMCTDYVSTLKALNNKEYIHFKIVKTTQLSFLVNTWDYINEGYRIYLHNENEIEIKEGIKTNTGKEVKRGHNILKLLLGGEFGKIK